MSALRKRALRPRQRLAACDGDLRVHQVVSGERVVVTALAGAAFNSLPAVAAIVQLDLVCAVGA